MRQSLRTVALVVLHVAAAAISVAAQGATSTPAASESNDWRTVVYPLYGWLPIYGADVRLPERPSLPGSGGGVTIPSATTSGNVNGAAAAGFRIERRRLSLDGQFLWAGLSGSVDAPRFEVSSDTSYLQLLGGIRVAPAFYIDGGVRRFGVSLAASILEFPEVRWKPHLWSPVVGATFRPRLGQKLRLMTKADFGASAATSIGRPRARPPSNGGQQPIFRLVPDMDSCTCESTATS